VLPIECCHTYPTRYYIRIRGESLWRNHSGRALRDFVTAQRALHEMQSQVEAGTFEPQIYKRQSKTAFSRFWDQFCRRYKHKPATKDKLRAIGPHLSVFHGYQMRDIKAHMIDAWWTDLELSPSYRNDVLVWLRVFMAYASELDVIEKVPRMPRPVDVPEMDIDFLTEHEQLKVLELLPAHDRPIMDFLFLTGVRVNEACALRREDVDWERGVVWIRNTVKRDKSIGPVKNKKVRMIPLSPEIRQCFKVAVPQLSEFRFVNKWGRRYRDEYLGRTFKDACIKAGIKPIMLKNATRHSFGMGLLNKGYDIWQVSKAMNHSSIQMTEKYVKMLGDKIAGMYGRSVTVPNEEDAESGGSK